MIIKRVTLTSFGGLSDRTVEFSPGLNIVFGENEAGKSTIFSGIEHLLLTPSKLTKNRFARELGRFLPVGGGDTIKAGVDFAGSSGKYALKKSWGAESYAELRLPDGSVVTDDAGVTRLLENLMPATSAVMKAVFLTYQSGMEKVLADLQSSRDALFDLREVLRQAIEGGDGYGADRFKDRLEEEIRTFYGRWDRATGGPEQGRSLSNPWKQGCGRVLADWYRAEELKRDLEGTTGAEKELAAIAGNLEKVVHERKQVSVFLKEHEKARDFASIRGDTLREIDRVEELEERHSVVYDRWPRIIERRSELAESLKKKKLEIDTLTKERETAREYDRIKSRIDEVSSKLQKAREYQGVLDQTEERLLAPGLVNDEDFAALEGQAARIEKLKRELSSGSLSLAVEAKKPVELEIRKGVDKPERVIIKGGEKVSFDTAGAVSIGHPDFTIIAGPGDADYPALEDEYRNTKDRLSEALTSLGVESVEAAEKGHRECKSITKEAELARGMLDATLSGETLADLEAELSSSRGEVPEKRIEEIQAELTTAEHERAGIEEEHIKLESTIEGYVSEYGEREAVLDLLVADRDKKKKLEKRIEEAPELPGGFDDWPSVIQACSDYRVRDDLLSEQILDFEKRKTELVTGMPDESAEEIHLQYQQAVMKFNRTKARASALERVLERTTGLLSAPEIEVSDDLKRAFEDHLRVITGGRYGESRFADDLPDGLLRGDGAVLTFNQLSSGTRDGFSLALRLAMARCFIGESNGFLVMDDPLVDMDDNRRPSASSLLKTYAADVQTIVFTCHETHASLFDESSVIRLGR